MSIYVGYKRIHCRRRDIGLKFLFTIRSFLVFFSVWTRKDLICNILGKTIEKIRNLASIIFSLFRHKYYPWNPIYVQTLASRWGGSKSLCYLCTSINDAYSLFWLFQESMSVQVPTYLYIVTGTCVCVPTIYQLRVDPLPLRAKLSHDIGICFPGSHLTFWVTCCCSA